LLELRNNGLGDLVAKDFEELRNYKRLKRLDLSGNLLGKAAVMQIIELLKGESVLDWLE
jgi:Ran GTPase-activating protein (RanGAP) involved in mRNA processing and transport